ncbi:thiamine phosphate synthase [uncultured Psychrobacter sp.]|uniref:thiamine phosphate synthase n=1 Tax=uncultured Psychrobacter sp. TaxID=259303 RepID=UPI00345A1D48
MTKHTTQTLSKPSDALSLYLVTDTAMCSQRGLIDTVCAAIEGGVTMVQLRDKHSSDEALYRIACQLKEAIAGRVPLVLNDRVHIAKKAKLDGVHLGQGDMSITKARSLLGADVWLGLSINTLEELKVAQSNHLTQLDYFGVGPVFATQTKRNHATPIGIEGLAKLVAASQLPTVAIGGIDQSNAAQVYVSGCNGIAVVSAICAAQNPQVAAKNLLGEQV